VSATHAVTTTTAAIDATHHALIRRTRSPFARTLASDARRCNERADVR
jgi:hypothetical protein